jgi:outer membrane lipoprotein-sorting protein
MHMLKHAVIVGLGLLTIVATVPPSDAGQAAGGFNVKDVLARMNAAYVALNSYADTGTVVDDKGGFADKSQFRTFYAKNPSRLFIEYKGIESLYKNGFRIPYSNRLVFWMQNGELQKWDHTGVHETYPSDGGGQVNALKSASYGSAGMTILIPSLIYTKANLATPIQAMEEPTAAGYEAIGGRRSFKVMGIERWRYPNGRITGVRPITIWIDAETYLIRKLLQDTPKGMAKGVMDQRIITIEPQANPKLDPNVFNFKVPADR